MTHRQALLPGLILASEEEPSRPAYTFLDEAGAATALSYGGLGRQARAIGAQLQRLGATGERALLLYPSGAELVPAFLSCLASGVVAVPTQPMTSERGLPRLLSIARDSRAKFGLTTSRLLGRFQSLAAKVPELAALTWVATDGVAEDAALDWREPQLGPEYLAFLQYTSGSTASPKGVMVSHGNLLHNEEMIRRAFGQSAESVIVGWLPLHHDMGLIGNVLQPLYLGAHAILMPPTAFLKRPLSWLEAIDRYRATTSGGPNFAYELCLKKIDAEQRAGLDLSSWEVAFNGAEPVRADTLERFAKTFAPQGFRRSAFYPCYGLAEATLLVVGGAKATPPIVLGVDRAALERREVTPSLTDGPESASLVGCGYPWLEQRVEIVDPEQLQRAGPGRIGEIWVAGPSVAQGYWGRPEETARDFGARLADDGPGSDGGPFLRTGDLGFLHEGELFVTGRLKDLIILRGRNLYPQDLELTAERSHPELRPGCSAAFSLDMDGEERLIVVCELDPKSTAAGAAIGAAIFLSLAQDHEVRPHEIVLLEAGSIPKTSSGKIQRSATRLRYSAGELPVRWRNLPEVPAEVEEELESGSSARVALLPTAADLRRSILEAHLTEQAARILGLPAAGLDPQKPLIAYGLDSLAAIEFQHALEGEFGGAVELADLLRGASIRQLAMQILAGPVVGLMPPENLAKVYRPDLGPVPVEVPAVGSPLTHGQQALWFLQRLQPENSAYNIHVAVDVRSRLDPEILRRSFERLAARHEALRYTFEETADGPVQRVCPGRTLEFSLADASGWSQAELDSRLREFAGRPFDLGRDPLLRVSVFRTSPDEHTLLLVVHHIIADLWSLSVLAKDFGEIYSGTGESPTSPKLRFTDYVAWQEQLLSGELGESLWAYWREQLRGTLPVLDLPLDRPRPQLQTFNGDGRSLRLATEPLERLKALASRHNATLYNTLLAAFQVLLHRYGGQEDVLVGSPIFARTTAALAELFGYFANPVVLRSDLSLGPTFDQLLARVRETALAAFAHQGFPFPLLVERLQPERDPSRSPLFDAMFVLQRTPVRGGVDLSPLALGESGMHIELGGLKLESRRFGWGTSQFDLQLLAAETSEGLGLVLIFNSDLFDGATAERVLGSLRSLLVGVAEHPELRIAELPLLVPSERHQLVVEWNDLPLDLADDRCLHELVAEQASLTPETVAAICGGSRLTYGDLERRANRLARHLRALGVGAETRVGVCLERGPELLPALLGVLKAGGAYVPLDPAYPQERLDFLLDDAQVPVLVTQASLTERFTAETTRVLVDTDREAIAARSDRPPGTRVFPDQLAYLIYTSGSTGRPKGVAIAHRNAVALLLWSAGPFAAAELAGVVASTSICFDLSIFELFVTLGRGGTVILVADALVVADLSEASGVTLINTVPSAIAELVRLGPPPAGLRTVNLAGEPLQRALVEQIESWHPGVRVLNLYGPSEDTTYSTWARVSGEEGAVRIGRPVAGSAVYLLDRQGYPVPRGVPGELYLGGAGLARGYLGRPDLTAAKFVPDPFSERPGGRLYATGDLVRSVPDGNLEYQGRIDHQVKIRGFRVEPGEIEAVLAAHPAVEAVAVVTREVEVGDRRLVAYVVARQVAGGDLDALRHHVAERLPGYMVPAAFVALAALPLTPNGKLDRRALPAPDWVGGQAPAAATAPRDPTEELLVGLWAELLGVDAGRIGLDSNFFSLGGHSLLATRLVARVRRDLRVEVPVRSLFEVPTPAGFARRVKEARQGPQAAPIRKLPRTGRLPLSFAQERLWFLDRLDPGSPTYNIPIAVELDGRLDTSALALSLLEIVRRHEVLRTTFALEEDRPVQHVGLPSAGSLGAPSGLPVIDLCGLAERREVARRIGTVESLGGFDLERGPLWRTTLLRLAEEEHAILLTFHHIAADGWSIGVFVRELSALYRAFAGRRPSPLPELPIQYVDFARWQREWMSGEILEGQLAYWRRQLEDAPVLELPSDRPPCPVRGSRGAALSLEIPGRMAGDLEEVARRHGATLFMFLCAGFAALLSRCTGQEDVAIGCPIANRNRAEIEDLIGFFVNTLVLRTDLSGDPSGRDLLARVREVALAAYPHQDLPFERLVQELQPRRKAEPLPLVRALLSLGADSAFALDLPGLSTQARSPGTETAKLDLTLQFLRADRGLAGILEYSSELFDATTAQRLSQQLMSLLGDLSADPELRLSELTVSTAAERHQMLAEWSGVSPELSPGTTIPALFAQQVQNRPDAVAMSSLGWSLTYGELDRRAGRLAYRLRRLGVGPEIPVGLFLERSPDLIVALAAVAKSGGVYVPLDPSHPRQRLAFILDQTRAPIVLTRLGLRGDLPEPANGVRARVLCLDHEASSIPEDFGSAADSAGCSPQNLAYILYTSGSTGEPKGVAVTHRAVVRLVRDTGYASFGPAKVFLQLAPVAFDASTLEIWGPLLNGGRLALAPSGPVTLADLERAIAREGVTTLWLTSGLFHQVIDQGMQLDGLRQLLAGGDVLSPPQVRRALERLSGGVLVNGYGPTENTTFTCCHRMTRAEEVRMPVPIGRPIARTSVFVVDRSGRPSPAGAAGELWAGGAGLARGYVGRPDLTADRFVPHPCGEPGERLYRTGDRVRFLPDGSLEFLGRIDQQVKVRGFRIEPGEIEAVLAAHPGVETALVVPQEVGPDDRRLVAYVVARPGQALDLDELRDLAAKRLPGYMVPASFVSLAALPLTANGKVDRRALPPPDGAGSEETSAPAPPRNPIEEQLVGLWAELLGVEPDRMGINSHFFELGGHSLLATRLISRVRADLRVEIPLRGLFEAPTPAGLARLILAARQGSEVPPLRLTPRTGRLPLSFAQERLWFLDQLEPGSVAYNIAVAVRLSGRLDRRALVSALGEIVRRHEALRTTFALAEGEPVQRIAPAKVEGLAGVDLTRLRFGRGEAERLAAAESGRPFDLASGPLLRTSLVRLAPEEHLLLVAQHHVISDGWSLGLFVRELSILYSAFIQGLPSPLPELPIQYPDFALWQREWLSGAVLEGQLGYWRQQLAGISTLELPSDRAPGKVRSARGLSLAVHLSAELKAELQALAHSRRATLFMMLAAGFQALLSRWSDQEDVAIGTAIANRNRAEVEGLIGFFVNTLVLRSDLSGDPDRGELLRRLREVTLDAYAHQDLPFEKLVQELAPERDLGHSPLIRVLLVLQNLKLPQLTLPDLIVGPLPAAGKTAKLDLTLSLDPEGEGLVGTLELAADLFDEATGLRLLAHFERLLGGLASAGGDELRLSTLPLLSIAESNQLVTAGTAKIENALASPDDLCLHELFAEQAARTPEATALVSGDSRLSYGEIERRANRLARHLRSFGVRAETPVGVCLERGPELLPALLGILAAGGTYVPLDPAYPQERLDFLLADAGVSVLVTQGSLTPRFAAVSTQVLVDGDFDATSVGGRAVAAWPPSAPDQLAYLIYTSGSTGRPKGVAIAHRSAVRLVRWALAHYSSAELLGVLASTSICFDLSIFELFVPLGSGGTVHLVTDALALPDLASMAEITLINTVPSAIAALLRLMPAPAGLRTVNLAGEALQRALVREVERWRPGVRLLNLYGPSEDTTYSTWAAMVPGEEGSPAIGRPVTGGSAYVLDRFGNLLPQGAKGELYLAGRGLARGYFGRPELTAAKFVPDPFSAQPGGRLYATGDLARMGRDGALDFLGRRDHQVKIRGFRIELGEIEVALVEHPAVGEAAVIAQGVDDLRLVAYLTLCQPIDPADLRADLLRRLPAHLVPSLFVVLAALPLSANGKLDRRALPAHSGSTSAPAEAAPHSPLEEVVAGVLAEILGLEQVGSADNFFDLGGHSLLATRAVSRLSGVLGVGLPLRQIFETPTVSALAKAIERLQSEALGAEPPIVRCARVQTHPLSFSQERLWFLDRLQPGNASYNMPIASRLRGALSPTLLARSLDEVVRRHETLRTTFGAEGGHPFQRIQPALSIPLRRLDLDGLEPTPRGAELERLMAAEGAAPFDLERGPLMRVRLFRLAAEEWVLQVNLHHIISDGWSLRRLFSELAWIYGAFALGAPSPLPELAVQYIDYAHWQRRWFQGEVLERHLESWRRRLGGTLPVLDLPTDRSRPPIQTFHGGSRSMRLSGGQVSELRALGRRRDATLFMTLFAAFNLLLKRYSGQDDILVGIPIAGRNRAEVENLIGFFINSLVLRTDLSGKPGFGALLSRVRQVALEAYAHQDLSFERLLQELRLERDLSRTPVFQVYFNFQSFAGAQPAMPGLETESLSNREELSKFDLTLYVLEEGSGEVRLDLVYNATLFSADRCREMLDQFGGLLAQIAAQPDLAIDRFSLITASARRLLPDAAQELDASWFGPVHRNLTAWALRDPDRPAVSDPNGAWSYGELEAQSNRLAHFLRTASVGTEDSVAIYAHRSATLVWAVLGALKAGAAFVALDPAYPPARIIEMLRLARPRAWLAMTAAGAVPEPIARFVAELPGCVSLELPPWHLGAPEALAALPTTDPAVAVGPDDLAYISFTSGSTGVPKGILGRHGPLSHFLPWQCAEFGLTEADRISLLSGLAHDPLQRDLFTPLYLGARICIPDPAEIIAPGKLSAWMRREAVSVAHLTPAMGQVLTESGPQSADSLPALRRVFLVGDILTRRDVARLRRLAPGVSCVNLYGSTETQRAVGYHVVAPVEIASSDARDKEILALGRGMRDVQLLVRNGMGEGAGIGEIGEIAVRSPHLSRGYLGDAASTALKFVTNPATGEAGDRLYLTGDLGRYLPDGEVAFAGRADTQVKIRGFRIEPGEIEAQLGRIQGVREAVVVATENGGAGSRLVAFVVPEPGALGTLSAGDLRDRLKEVLPAYMVPSGLLFLATLPLTPNAKVDRRDLLRLAGAQREEAADFRAPRTEAEVLIAGILREVLGVERIGAEDNFFDLGGNSLLLLQVQARVQAAFRRELAVLDLFANPTVSALARHLAAPEQPEPVGTAAGAFDGAEQLDAGKRRRLLRFQQNQKAAVFQAGGRDE